MQFVLFPYALPNESALDLEYKLARLRTWIPLSPCTSSIIVGTHYNITESSFLGENTSALLMVLTLMLLLWLHKYLLNSRMSK